MACFASSSNEPAYPEEVKSKTSSAEILHDTAVLVCMDPPVVFHDADLFSCLSRLPHSLSLSSCWTRRPLPPVSLTSIIVYEYIAGTTVVTLGRRIAAPRGARGVPGGPATRATRRPAPHAQPVASVQQRA